MGRKLAALVKMKPLVSQMSIVTCSSRK